MLRKRYRWAFALCFLGSCETPTDQQPDVRSEPTDDATLGDPDSAIIDAATDAHVSDAAFSPPDASVQDALVSFDASPSEAGVEPVCTGKCWQDSFGAAPVGKLSKAYLTENWPTASFAENVNAGRTSVIEESSNKFVRVLLPKGEVGAPDGGTTWRRRFSETMEATLEYKVRFEPNFEWTKGGKIPGLTGGNSPTGGNDASNGFSSRYMWQTNGGLILYLYHARMGAKYGEAFSLGKLTQGKWYTLKQRIRMNTPGQQDGALQVWVDGVLKLDRSDMEWRLAGKTWKIDSLLFTAFHGGNNAEYTPNRDNLIDFDDFQVITE